MKYLKVGAKGGLLSPRSDFWGCGFMYHANLARELISEIYPRLLDDSVNLCYTSLLKAGWLAVRYDVNGHASFCEYKVWPTSLQRDWLIEHNLWNSDTDEPWGEYDY